MKRLVCLALLLASLAVAGTASAGCMATVGLSSVPRAGHQAGEPWLVTMRVLQHGRTPMPDAKPVLRIRNADGKLISFKGRKTLRVGSYQVRVVFPTAGLWRLAVYDGFPSSECAREHTFKAVMIEPAAH